MRRRAGRKFADEDTRRRDPAGKFAVLRRVDTIEAGAADGLFISNTVLLERDLGWTGILIEPTRFFDWQSVRLRNAASLVEQGLDLRIDGHS